MRYLTLACAFFGLGLLFGLWTHAAEERVLLARVRVLEERMELNKSALNKLWRECVAEKDQAFGQR